MILRRLTENLRAQNWTAITIEFVIVVVGVFLGTQVANWNLERIEKRETERMLVQLVPELQSQLQYFDDVRTYYGVTRRYAEQALAGWNGASGISDEQFVIAAYQASQITGIGTNAENWALTFGGEQLRNIDDANVRRNLEVILTSDYGPISLNAAASPYRQQVRRVIPMSVQDAIRRECGDRFGTGHVGFVRISLPETCGLKIPAAEAARIASSLRARPELAQELNWHLAGVAVVLTNVDILQGPVRDLNRELAKVGS
ncbi:MAG TPA: hypothetical protein VJ763_07265 [Sphingomicrobium sp.]|jgi:hypothetical protein|nr:hypothetical protein [Sphingomicrobium sp.]